MENQNIISQSLQQESKNDLLESSKKPLLDLLKDLLSNPDLLGGLPVVKFLFQLNDIRVTWQNVHFLRKYSCFIGIIEKKFDSGSLDIKLNEICQDQKIRESIIENTIIELDRYHTTQKAILLGYLFTATFNEKYFTTEEYNNLIFGIDYMHPTQGIDCLQKFYVNAIEMEKCRHSDNKMLEKLSTERARIDFSPLVQTGLITLPIGGSYLDVAGGASLKNLGKRFFEFVVKRYLEECV